MNMFKTVMASAAALGLVVSGTANAEPLRAAHSFPGVMSKAARTTAPKSGESSQSAHAFDLGAGNWFIAFFAATGAFLGGYYVFRDGTVKPVSPGA